MKRDYPIEIIIDNNEYKFIFPEKYRNLSWSEYFGEIQNILRNISDINIKVIFDLSKVTWIDPLPLLSLQISIAELNKNEIRVYLPRIDANYGYSNKILAFLLSEGFFECFPNNVSFYEDSETIVKNFLKYDKLIGELQYSNCSIIKAHLVNLYEIKDIKELSLDKWIYDIIQKARYNIKNKVESYKAEEVINRLQTLLFETISNVYEHAYPKNNNKYVGFYVRFRNGYANTSIGNEERKKLKYLISEEHDNSPMLQKYFIDNLFNFIEVFIIDSGCGLTSNYFTEKEKKGNIYPFRSAWDKAFIKGIRGINSNKKSTQKGGLYTINRSLGNNYICARDENEWIGHSLPLRSSIVPSSPIYKDDQIKGFSLIKRIPRGLPRGKRG